MITLEPLTPEFLFQEHKRWNQPRGLTPLIMAELFLELVLSHCNDNDDSVTHLKLDFLAKQLMNLLFTVSLFYYVVN